jgi:hypothetical protein
MFHYDSQSSVAICMMSSTDGTAQSSPIKIATPYVQLLGERLFITNTFLRDVNDLNSLYHRKTSPILAKSAALPCNIKGEF